MPLTVQIFLSVALVVLVAGIVLALLRFPKGNPKALFSSRERVRALAGLLAVLGSDAAIVAVVIWGAGKLGGVTSPEAIALVTGAFTVVGTMTTAYLGIKAVSNTAQVLAQNQGGGSGGPNGESLTDPTNPGGPAAAVPTSDQPAAAITTPDPPTGPDLPDSPPDGPSAAAAKAPDQSGASLESSRTVETAVEVPQHAAAVSEYDLAALVDTLVAALQGVQERRSEGGATAPTRTSRSRVAKSPAQQRERAAGSEGS